MINVVFHAEIVTVVMNEQVEELSEFILTTKARVHGMLYVSSSGREPILILSKYGWVWKVYILLMRNVEIRVTKTKMILHTVSYFCISHLG